MAKRQQGMALLIVLLVVAVIAALAVDINGRSQLAVQRTLNQAQYHQAYWYAMAAEELAKKVLKQDLDDSEGRVHLQQYWASPNIVFPVDEGQIAGRIKDLRSCFNLNAVSVEATEQEKQANSGFVLGLPGRQYQAMLEALEFDSYGAERLTHTLKDYTDSDTVTSPYGAEDADYESRQVPYRAANTLMNHRSELRAVIGYSQQVYQKLQDYVCAIPGDTTQVLNVNTLKPEQAALLVGMLQGQISLGEAQNLLNQRPSSGWEKMEDFWQESAVRGLQLDGAAKSSLSVSSSYFDVQAAARLDESIFRLSSVMKKGGNNQMQTLTRQYGGQR
ncbi:type II secretion system minor pseudopilin GspK [Paraferrimonas sedimenticola]|uniref:Type II secretion system protein K n=1 Tax=Paraferrimonas sedimenticola TaxID=375674 RepID=A0AA37RVE5_9GAMM|nr:type II secretion system minor pseudopilin GspK [Paraferrimonas sedimenticola]GLP95918.1 type II secretion system protein K [Paraferrimonas sedimenticola]